MLEHHLISNINSEQSDLCDLTNRNNSSFGSFLLIMASSLFENIWGKKIKILA